MKMTSNKSYLLRALHEWILDNHCTPYILVDAQQPGVDVPQDYVQNGQIVFNLAPRSIRELQLHQEAVEFDASFVGELTHIYVPVGAILAIYAKENGYGMAFQVEETEEDGSRDSEAELSSETEGDSEQEDELSKGYSNEQNSDEQAPKRGKPNLKIIK